jgi:pimeloyl-ACP methyl ester carboxylesterase
VIVERCPLVLLPGSLCDARLFEPQAAALRSRAVTVGDITSADSIEAIAAHVLGSSPPRFAVAGLSMGAIVAFEIWRQAPRRVAGLAVFDSTHRAEASHVAARRQAEIELVQREGTAGLRRLLREIYLPKFFYRTRATLEDRMLQMATACGPEVLVRQWRALMTRPDSLSTLESVSVPALVARGADDQMCPVDLHEAMATALGVRCHQIERCGHLPSLEAPAQTSGLLRGWLLRVDAFEREVDHERQTMAC